MRTKFLAVLIVWGLLSVYVNAAVITIGTGTSRWNYPMATFFHDGRTQTIYLASEIGGAKTLTSLALNVTTLPGQTMTNFTIRLKHTDLSAYGVNPAWESSAWTTVYQTNQSLSNTGWATFLFATPFAYNGTQNIMVDISFDNSLSTSDGYCRSTSLSVGRSIYGSSNSSHGDPLTWTNRTPSPYKQTYCPNIRLGDEVIGRVPNVIGVKQESAQMSITAAGFITGNVTWAYDDVIAIGNVVSLSPPAGTVIPVGSAVDMVISLGRAVTVPDVTGMTQADAQSVIESVGLIAGTVTNIISTFVAPGCIISHSPAGGTTVSAGSAVNLVVSLGYYHGGSGTAGDPYQIADVNDMMLLAADTSNYNKCFILTADIDMSGVTGTEYPIIGYYTDYFDYLAFTGTFDGNGHVIRNFTYANTYKNYVGLFGYIDKGAVIQDLGLEACAVSCEGEHFGILAGMVSGGIIKNCYCTGTLTVGAGSRYIGGLAGSLTIPDSGAASPGSSDAVRFSMEYQTMGSFEDTGFSGIINCYAAVTITAGSYCSYIGGLAGFQDAGNIVTSYAASPVSCDSSCYFAGGLIGASDGVINCFWDTQISGLTTGGGGKGRTTAQMQDPENYVGWNSPEDTVWILDEGSGYPRLYWQGTFGRALPAETLDDYLAGDGTESSPYLIENAEQLNTIGLFPENWDQYYQLVADVNLVTITGVEFNRIGANFYMPFGGVFSGNHHRVFDFTYLTEGMESNIGLFGYAKNCTIQDLNVENLLVSSPCSVIGGLVGWLDSGTMTACLAKGSVTGMGTECHYLGGMVGKNSVGNIIQCISEVDVCSAYQEYAGGLLGYSYRGTIEDCHSKGAVSGYRYIGGLVGYNDYNGTITDSSSSSPVTGTYRVGGLVGCHYYEGVITGCRYNGTVTGNAESQSVGGLVGYSYYDCGVLNCNSAGQVTGKENVGGLIGYSYATAITNCHSSSTVTGVEGSQKAGGLVGYHQHWPIRTSWASGNVSGTSQVGGLVGHSYYYATLDRCFASGHVAATGDFAGGLAGYTKESCTITQCYATGNVTGRKYVGGLLGYEYTGNVSNCYSTGQVSGVSYLGGLIGNGSYSIVSCFWDKETSGMATSSGGTGKTTAEMKTLSTFTSSGWDFAFETTNGTDDIWRMCADGVDYPRLSLEYPSGDFVCPDGVGSEDLAVLTSCWLNITQAKADIDNNNVVDFGDVLKLSQNWLLSGCGVCNNADITGDSTVNELDLTKLAVQWLLTESAECRIGDLNEDGGVNMSDWAIFAGSWMEGM